MKSVAATSPPATGGTDLRLLVVEDNPGDRLLLRQAITHAFRDPGHQLTSRDTLGGALACAGPFDVVLLDLGLPDAEPDEVLHRALERYEDVPVVVLTGQANGHIGLRAVQRGAQDYLRKGEYTPELLQRSVLYAIERHRLARQLRRMIATDPTTGLMNQRGMEEVLSRESSRAEREGLNISALFVDLDDFKRINDGLGHAVGDILLREVGRKIEALIRDTDYACRCGGDEFMVLLPETRSAEARLVAEKVRMALAESPLLIRGEPLRVSASVCVIQLEGAFPAMDELLVMASRMLYRSKLVAKNRVDAGDGHASATLEEILESLQAPGALRAVAQRIVDLSDESCIGYELLSRSNVPVFEMPEDIFRVSNETRRLTDMDLACFENCVRAAAGLPEGRPRHVNIYPSTLLEVPVHRLLTLLGDADPSHFCLEISEQQILGDPSYLLPPVQALRQAGVQIAIDDVGFGRSSMESLVLLEPHVAKIDRRLIHEISRDTARQRTLRRLVQVLESLQCDIVAEGVETRQDADAIITLGLHAAQGWLWGRPAPVDALLDDG